MKSGNLGIASSVSVSVSSAYQGWPRYCCSLDITFFPLSFSLVSIFPFMSCIVLLPAQAISPPAHDICLVPSGLTAAYLLEVSSGIACLSYC